MSRSCAEADIHEQTAVGEADPWREADGASASPRSGRSTPPARPVAAPPPAAAVRGSGPAAAGIRRFLARSLIARSVRLTLGIFVLGVAISLLIAADLGLGPWEAFNTGLARVLGLSVGITMILVGAALVLGAMALGTMPGPGTVIDSILLGFFVDAVLPLVQRPPGVFWSWVCLAGGIVLFGISTGLYVGARMGQGPVDGLMLAISGRTGWSVRLVRTIIEVSVLIPGWLMGGKLGLGTVAIALGVGPSIQWGLRLFGILPAGGTPAAAREPA